MPILLVERLNRMEEDLLAGGKHYELLVNWEKRIKNDIPFIVEFLNSPESKVESVLEVGCGTGRHAEVLHKENRLNITGVDISESMIKEAKQRLPEANLIMSDFLNEELLKDKKFDAIFSIGNSTGLIAQTYDFDAVIKRFSDFIKISGGVLIFHLLNTEKERNGWSKPRSVITDDGEYIFLRGFTTDESHVHPEILTLFRRKDSNDWEMHTRGRANIPRIKHNKMISILQKYGFKNTKVFGNFQKEEFDPENSVDMIFVTYT